MALCHDDSTINIVVELLLLLLLRSRGQGHTNVINTHMWAKYTHMGCLPSAERQSC